MNEPKDPEAAETVQTDIIKAVDPAAICSLLEGPIIDDCSPHLAAYLREQAGEVPTWFSEKWDSLFGANTES